MPGFWISRVTQGFRIFVNFTGFWLFIRMQLNGMVLNNPGSWICQVSAYVSMTQSSDYASWIWLKNAWTNCSDYGRILNRPAQKCFEVLNMSLVLSRARAWNMARFWICEYAKILNVSDAVHSIRLLCKSLSSYWDKHIQNTVKKSRIVPECRCTFIFGGQGKFCETTALW